MSEERPISIAKRTPNEWADRLLDLEQGKKNALLAFDPESYEVLAREQARLVADGVPDLSRVSRDRGLSLARRSRINSALLLNLASISPHFAHAESGYTSAGEPAQPTFERVKVEG